MQLKLIHLEEKKLQNATKQNKMGDVTKYASDLQTFIGLKKFSSDITTDVASLQSLLINGSLDKLEIKLELDENIIVFLMESTHLDQFSCRKYLVIFGLKVKSTNRHRSQKSTILITLLSNS